MAKIRKMIFYIFSTLLSLLLAFCLADIAHLREQYSTYADLVDEQRNNWIVDQHQLEQCLCTVPIESKPISQEDFINKYAFKSPVVFRRSASPNDRNMLFTQACQLDNLARNYGNKVITVSTANTHSYAKSSMKLSDYLNEYVKPHANSNNSDQFNPTLKYGNETWYFFGENNYAEWKELFDLYERPAYELPDHHHAYSFGIAAAGTGVNMHTYYHTKSHYDYGHLDKFATKLNIGSVPFSRSWFCRDNSRKKEMVPIRAFQQTTFRSEQVDSSLVHGKLHTSFW